MRLIKMFGLAAIAAVAAMAFVGVSSAMATEAEEVVVCAQLESPCAAANKLGSGTKVMGEALNPVLLGPFNVTCEKGNTEGEIKSTLAQGEITSVTWANCKEEGTTNECTVTTKNLPFAAKAELTTTKGYVFKVTNHAGGSRPSAKIVCPANNLECTYGANPVEFEYLDPGAGQLALLDILQTLTGEGLCGLFGSGVWHAQYKLDCLTPSLVDCWLAME